MQHTCLILAGGLGSRLRAVLEGQPKCLAPVCGKPFIYWQIESLKSRGVTHFILALGYGADQVKKAIKHLDGAAEIECVTEPRALGTGGAIAFALDATGLSEVLVANGDTFLGGDLKSMLTPLQHDAGEYLRLGSTFVEDRARFGGLEKNADGRVIRFFEKGVQGPGLINAGLYRVHRDALSLVNESTYSLESEVFPILVNSGNLFAVDVAGPFIDIGVPEDYSRYCNEHDRFQ